MAVPSNGMIVRRGEATVLRAGQNLNATVHYLLYGQRVHFLFPTREATYVVPLYEDSTGTLFQCYDHDSKRQDVIGGRVPDYSGSMDIAWRAARDLFERYPEREGEFFGSLQQQAAGPGEWVRWPRVLMELADRFPEAICQAIVIAIRGKV